MIDSHPEWFKKALLVEKEKKIIENLSELLGVSLEIINVKGKSADDYGIIGDQKASLAIVSLLLENA